MSACVCVCVIRRLFLLFCFSLTFFFDLKCPFDLTKEERNKEEEKREKKKKKKKNLKS